MLQSILITLGILVVIIFFLDVRRRARSHSKAVQKERDAIAEMTHSTATMSTFNDGGSTEVVLGASEDSGLFFYRRIDNGKLVLPYTLRLNNLTRVAIQLNGEKRDFTSESVHLTAQMRATDMARRARQGLPVEELEKIKNIRLTIFFRSENGGEKSIPVTMHKAGQRGGTDALAKNFENAVWWQQYLNQLSKRKFENDTLTFRNEKE